MEIDERVKRVTDELDELRKEFPGCPWAFVVIKRPGELTSDWDGDALLTVGAISLLKAKVLSPIVRQIDAQLAKKARPAIVPARLIPGGR